VNFQKIRYLSFAGLFFFQSTLAFSQKRDSLDYYNTGFNVHYGFIIPHTEAIEPVSHTRPYGFDLSFNKLSTSFDSWRVFNRYNSKGVQLGYFNYQNPKVLGSAFVLSVFTEPIISSGEKYIFSIKAGAGLSYHTKVYDYYNDSLNKFFSTRLSFPLYLMVRFKYRISNNYYLTLSGCYNHISNGAIKIPNYGMNFPTLLVGLEYYRRPLPGLETKYAPVRDYNEHSRFLVIQALMGYKEVYGEWVYAFGLHTRYTWQIRNHYALNGGAEIILDGGVKKMIEIENKSVDYERIALTAGQDFIFGKVIFTQYFGFYVYSPYKAKNSIYQKYELLYRFIPQLSAGFYLKAHTSDAELFGLSMNYYLQTKLKNRSKNIITGS
jgi:hypothetical protein